MSRRLLLAGMLALTACSPTSGYYARSKQPPSARARHNAELRVRVRKSRETSRRTYGRPASTPTSRPKASTWRQDVSPASCGKKGSGARAGGAGRLSRRCRTPTLAPRPISWPDPDYIRASPTLAPGLASFR